VSAFSRIVAAMGAGAFGQAVSIGIQVFSLPMFLSRWDASTYGTWLLLSAMPSYLSMADVGMVATAGNRMTMAMGRGEDAEANTIFHSAFAFVTLMCLALCAIAAPIVWLSPESVLANADQKLAVMALVLGVLLAMFGGLSDALFRATNRYALGTMLGNVIRIAEWAGYMAGLFVIGTFAGVACCGLAARLLGILMTIVVAARGGHAFTWGWRNANAAEIKAMLKPALSFMAFPLANALSFQGVTLMVGHYFGPATVALFNTYRTISRVAVQVTGVFGHSLWVEFSMLFGKGGAKAVEALYRRAFWIGMGSSVALSVALYFVAPYLLEVWSRGQIPFEPMPMALLLVYAACGGFWHVPRVMLLSTNQHFSLAQWALVSAGLVIGLIFAIQSKFGLPGVCASMVIAELLIAVVCIWLARGVFSAQAIPLRVSQT
jgi:O-antigen/teichoic acid export membrane protein